VTLTAVAASGWQFSSWSGALSGSTNPQMITMTSNKSVTANFTEIPAGGSVTSSANASTHTPTVGQQITAAINIDMTNMASPDNALGSFTASLAWDPAVLSYVSDSGILSGFTGVINTNNAASGTMTFNGANASGATGNNQILTVTFNVVGAGTSALDLGYSAMAAAGSFNSLLPYLTVNDDSVTASLPTYTLTVNKVGQGTVALNPPGGTYSQGAQVQLTATPASGWKFDGWSGDLSGSTNPATITMNGTKTVTATFSEIPVTQYTLTVNKVGSGSVSLSPSGGVYDSGTSVQLTATPAAGYKFDGWSGDLSGTTNPASITMNSNKTVTATFSQIPANQYNLNILTNGQGSVTLNPAGGTYDAGTVVELTATPASGWQFAGWSGALSGMTNPTSITMDSNKTVTATFSQIPVEQYTLTVNTVGQGSVTLKPSGGIYDAGTGVTLTAVPESGWQFDGWSGDLSGTLATKVILMNSDKEVTATFTEIPAGQYALTVYTTGEGEVTLSPPGGSYDDGTEVTLTAVPEDGWKFAGWLGDLSGTANPESIVMNGDKKVSANFIKELFLPVVSKN